MPQLHETMMGQKLIEVTLPNIEKHLKEIADSLRKPDYSSTEVPSAFKSYVKQFSNDEELGRNIRSLFK